METEIPNQNTFVLNDSVRDSYSCYEPLSRRFIKSTNPDRIFQTKKRFSQVKSLTKKLVSINFRQRIPFRINRSLAIKN